MRRSFEEEEDDEEEKKKRGRRKERREERGERRRTGEEVGLTHLQLPVLRICRLRLRLVCEKHPDSVSSRSCNSHDLPSILTPWQGLRESESETTGRRSIGHRITESSSSILLCRRHFDISQQVVQSSLQMKPSHLTPYVITIILILISVSTSCSSPSPESRKYGNMEYDKDMLESVLKEVLNDEITKLSKPSTRGISDDRSERLDPPARKSSSPGIGMDDYLDRLTGSSERQSGSSSSDYRSSLMERPSLSDGR